MDITISKIEQVTLKIDRPAMGVNSRTQEQIYPEPGWTWDEPIIRIEASDGTLGWGPGRADPDLARLALGQSPFALLDPAVGVSDEFRELESALWDTIGKLLGLPVYKLLGDRCYADWIPAYDSTIYFNDLLYDDRVGGLKRIAGDIEKSLRNGFRACKMKIGRGNYLMERRDGLRRDVEVVQTARRVAGEGFAIMVDANNAYSYEETISFLSEVGDLNIFWVEEMFQEDVEKYRDLRTFMKERGLETLIADGETRSYAEVLTLSQELEFFRPFFQAGVLDVVQHDIRMLGLSGWRDLSEMAGRFDGVRCAPHNFASILGVYLSLHLGKSIPDFLYAEVLTLSSDVINASGYIFKDGKFNVPDLPGLGLELNPQVYDAQYAGREDWQVD